MQGPKRQSSMILVGHTVHHADLAAAEADAHDLPEGLVAQRARDADRGEEVRLPHWLWLAAQVPIELPSSAPRAGEPARLAASRAMPAGAPSARAPGTARRVRWMSVEVALGHAWPPVAGADFARRAFPALMAATSTTRLPVPPAPRLLTSKGETRRRAPEDGLDGRPPAASSQLARLRYCRCEGCGGRKKGLWGHNTGSAKHPPSSASCGPAPTDLHRRRPGAEHADAAHIATNPCPGVD